MLQHNPADEDNFDDKVGDFFDNIYTESTTSLGNTHYTIRGLQDWVSDWVVVAALVSLPRNAKCVLQVCVKHTEQNNILHHLRHPTPMCASLFGWQVEVDGGDGCAYGIDGGKGGAHRYASNVFVAMY